MGIVVRVPGILAVGAGFWIYTKKRKRLRQIQDQVSADATASESPANAENQPGDSKTGGHEDKPGLDAATPVRGQGPMIKPELRLRIELSLRLAITPQ